MNLNLKSDQVFNAILFMVVQNNIALRTMSKTMIEYIAEASGDDTANKFESIMNDLSSETQDEVLAHLKTMFGDVDDIDLNKLF
ncbi:MAG: peroxidase family protein [Bacteroidota bacterium]|nr:peroxidase family protein [Bacteroidota bacterium]